jgi:crossover junction endodeoxyribonuclease RuvC
LRILGIDPGLQITGYGLVDFAGSSPTLVEAGTLRSHATWSLEKRLLELHEGLEQILSLCHPDMMAVESLFSNYRHPTSALQMAHARGVLFLAASKAGVPVFSYEPARVKKSLTGRGRATKSQMQAMIRSVFNLEATPHPADVADALAVALCHANSFKEGRVRRERDTSSLPPVLAEALSRKSSKTRKTSRALELIEELTKTS